MGELAGRRWNRDSRQQLSGHHLVYGPRDSIGFVEGDGQEGSQDQGVHCVDLCPLGTF